MAATLWRQAEHYLGTAIEPSEWGEAKGHAERKLRGIIERYGDEGGARRRPEYMAHLIAEAVRGSRLTRFSLEAMELLKQADESNGVKKDSPCKKHEPPLTVPLL